MTKHVGKVIIDKFANVLAGLGAANVKTQAGFYTIDYNQDFLDKAYLGSTWFGKIVDIPADDATRAWRSWQAQKPQIEKLEATEKRLAVRPKVRQALIWSRLYGGAAVIPIGLPGNPTTPLELDRVGAGSIKGLSVVAKHDINASGFIRDPMSPWFGYPEKFTIAGQTLQTELHPSRVIMVNGRKTGSVSTQTEVWGTSIWTSLADAIMACDGGAAVIDALLQEAKIDVIRMPEMMSNVATEEYEQLLISRFRIAAQLKSVSNALVLDKEDEWEQKQISWAGLPDVMYMLLTILSGAADIPVTRLLGTSAKGLNATGEGDLKNYYDAVKAKQELVIQPMLTPLDEILIRDALGTRPTEIWYDWDPLFQLSEKEEADIDKLQAETANIYATTGLIPMDALAEVVQNRMVESGRWPGMETALEESTMELELPEPDADEPETQEGAEPSNTQRVGDAAPRSLYVRRDVLNAAEIIAHFKRQGFAKTITKADMHVTITFSREEVDWMKIGQAWEDKLEIPAGGPRIMEKFGEATVLTFASNNLFWRHDDMIRNGASWDHSEYNPHITISWEFDGDLASVEPWTGKIVLGPEIFQEVKEDWQAGIVEDRK